MVGCHPMVDYWYSVIYSSKVASYHLYGRLLVLPTMTHQLELQPTLQGHRVEPEGARLIRVAEHAILLPEDLCGLGGIENTRKHHCETAK